MSYDLRIWTVEAADLPRVLPETRSWAAREDGFAFERRGWQALVSRSSPVEPEDVPPEVAGLVPGIGFVTELSIEPLSAPRSALSFGSKAARAIARQARGVVDDPQQDTVKTPAGVRRYTAARRPERFDLIELTWWFTDSPLLTRAGLDEFVDGLARHLPDGLPRRYGPHEPPEYRLEQTGLEHFRVYLAAHGGDIVWYPRRPVVDVTVHAEQDWGVGAQGFRCGYASLAVERAALDQPGWERALRTWWTRASRVVRPFYGDVRTLTGFVHSGATYSSDMKTQTSPVRGPFWRGIPRDPGQALVVGPEYLALWPELAVEGRTEDGLAFVTTDDWASRGSVLELTGPVPSGLAMRHTPEWTERRSGGWSVDWNTEYPTVWPFGPQPPPDE